MLTLPEQLAIPLEMGLAEDCPATSRRDLEGHKLVVETMKAEILDVVAEGEALPAQVSSAPQSHVSLALRSNCCGADHTWCAV